MFGAYYKNRIGLEIFLRYLKSGPQKISDIKKDFYYVSDRELSHIIKEAITLNLIVLNKETKTIFMFEKIKNVINFIEKFNFIDEVQEWANDHEHMLSEELNSLLIKTDFFNRNLEKNVNLVRELNTSIKSYFNENYTAEISCFNFKFERKKVNIDEKEDVCDE